jgi:hypothetical protein
MQMKGQQLIAAPRARVWAALNDPAVLAQCIPGCQSLEREGDQRFRAVAEVKIGPIGARFKGDVVLSELDELNGYTITGSGNGGIAGSAKGIAKVRLSDAQDGGTLVAYDVDADVGGRMAQLGGPIIDATAKNLAAKFFGKFAEVTGAAAPSPTQATAAALAESQIALPAPSPKSSDKTSRAAAPQSLWGWVVALVMALFAGFMLGRSYNGLVVLVVAFLMIVTAAAAYEAGRRAASR